MYRTREEHSADCAKYPIEAVPQRIFLDTNVVNLMVKQRASVFEQEPIPDTLEREAAIDTEALMHITSMAFRGGWAMVVSAKTIEEISQTVDDVVREDLLDYAFEVVHSDPEDTAYAADLGRRVADSPLIAALPDRNDRELLGNAIAFGCDVFCTRDHRTIVRKRDLLPKLPLRILTPREWWFHVKPWGGLLV
ncbi:MAG: hypothetical protein P0Y59_10905 [Candidatus Sphingomonas phytovorans]|nr:hypothetical protein [Sphingomonas sp.]WEK02156.1 MAG: hypothetical protein P0Y59_10905 [Sphingomonas sp.]